MSSPVEMQDGAMEIRRPVVRMLSAFTTSAYEYASWALSRKYSGESPVKKLMSCHRKRLCDVRSLIPAEG